MKLKKNVRKWKTWRKRKDIEGKRKEIGTRQKMKRKRKENVRECKEIKETWKEIEGKWKDMKGNASKWKQMEETWKKIEGKQKEMKGKDMKGSERKKEEMKRNELQRKDVKEKLKEMKGQKKEKQKEMWFSSCPLTSPRPPCLNPLKNPKGCFISFQFYLSVGLGSAFICFQFYVCRLARIPRSSKTPGEKLLFITSHGVSSCFFIRSFTSLFFSCFFFARGIWNPGKPYKAMENHQKRARENEEK